MSFDIAKLHVPLLFSDSYQEARSKFISAAPNSKQYKYDHFGPSGDDLYTDVAYFGPANASRMLVLVSGTHGVEGYTGSAAQLLFLTHKFQEMLPPSTAVLMIHALGAYGFAWDRRFTAEHVDLNRNFVDFSKPLPENHEYERLADLFIPSDLEEETLNRAEAALKTAHERMGDLNFRMALAGGQYTRPGGLFYGGRKPTEERRTLERIAADFNVKEREKVIIVDYHTGLGPYGYGEIQCELSSGEQGYRRALRIFGSSVTSPVIGDSSSVSIPGTQDEFWQQLLGDRHTYVTPEFGTYPSPRGRLIISKDLWLFTHEPDAVTSELGCRIRGAVKSYFYPEASDWKEMVLWRCHQVHRQAIDYFLSGDC
ncbi:DUF2817 domain-containing protein [Mesorhizobium sp. M0488]|uniref:DUF2817 domain-containing protein n=1 Tax=unclassified Mesorhizobium TaxID=325217 RepID=UPI003339B052